MTPPPLSSTLLTLGLLGIGLATGPASPGQEEMIEARLASLQEEMIEARLASLQARRRGQTVGTGKGQFSRIRDEDRELADLAAR